MRYTNLDSVQESHANQVPLERMKKGAPGVVSLLEKSPPRLILPIEKACIDVLREALVQRGYDLGTNDEFPLAVPIAIFNNPKRLHHKLSGFRIDGAGPLKGSVVVRLPQHPAHIFRANYATACGKAVDAFLSNLPRQVRSQVAPAKKRPIRYSPVRRGGLRAKTFGV